MGNKMQIQNSRMPNTDGEFGKTSSTIRLYPPTFLLGIDIPVTMIRKVHFITTIVIICKHQSIFRERNEAKVMLY